MLKTLRYNCQPNGEAYGMITPLLSIITINLNNAAGLRRTIESVVSQIFTDYEYIIIDGGSSDGSVDIIKEYHDKISYWVSEPDKGIYNGMNKGIMHAKGHFLQFLNSGDYFVNKDVLSMIFSDKTEDYDVIYGDLARTFPDGKNDIVKMPDIVDVLYLYNASLAHPACLIKKRLFITNGYYDDSYKIAADHAFFVKIFLLTNIKYKHVNIVVANFPMNGTCCKLSNSHTLSAERIRSFNEQLPNEYIRLIKDYIKLISISKKLNLERILPHIINIKKHISKSNIKLNNVFKNYIIYKLINPFKINYRDVPIIINNRNRVTYLKRLIRSLEKRGYTNIHIIDNNSDYPPLLDYYKECKYKIYRLNSNAGFGALWDSNLFNDYFRNQFYIYTDSDMELEDGCPSDFVQFMLFNLWRHKKIDKIGLSITINDIPDCYCNKSDVITWESKFWREKYDSNLYEASVDTTFAIYKPNKIGPAGFMRSLRLRPPYSIKHLPWYEDSMIFNKENHYYNQHADKSTHWNTI